MAKLYFSYASMNAGKSTLLLQASHNYRERGMHTLLLTAAILFPTWADATGATKISLIYPAYYLVLSFWLGNLRTVIRTTLRPDRNHPTDSG